MNATHTPGPWVNSECTRIGHDEYMHQIRTGEGEDHPIVALVPHGSEVENPTADANARLISAAPELLAALERLLELWEETIDKDSDYMPMADFARAAIAKAKGEA